MKWAEKRAYVWWISSMTDFTPVSDDTLSELLNVVRRRETLSVAQRSVMDAAFVRAVLRTVGMYVPVIQLCYGTQYITKGRAHGIQRAAAPFSSTLGYLLDEFRHLHFNILNGYEPDEPVLCSLCQGYHNISLGGFWWHTFYPSVMYRAWHRRLDMVPLSRLMGFFSDGYCVDWQYGRLRMTQRVLATVLDEKIKRGFYSAGQALKVAQAVMHDTPKAVFLSAEK
jgi:hypothetical protein